MMKAEHFDERQKAIIAHSEGEIDKVMAALEKILEKSGKFVCGD